MKWGTFYATDRIEPDQVAAMLRRAFEDRGFRVQCTSDDGSVTLTICRRTRVGLRQKMAWHVLADPGRAKTTLRLDVRYSTVSRCVLGSLFGAVTCIWVMAFSTFLSAMGGQAAMTVHVLWQPAVAVLMMLGVTLLAMSAGTRDVAAFLDRVRCELRVRGRSLDKELKGGRQRQAAAAFALLAYFVAVNVLTLALVDYESACAGHSLASILLFASGTVMLLCMAGAGTMTLVLAVGRRGAEERLVLTTPALQSSIALLLMLAGQLSFLVFANLDQQTWDGVFAARESLTLQVDPIVLESGATIPRPEVVHALRQARLIVGVLFGLTALLWLNRYSRARGASLGEL